MPASQKNKNNEAAIEPRDGIYDCTLCDSHFETASGLQGHMNVHNKKYSCHLCGKCFRGSYAVQEHMKTHAGVSTKKEPRDPKQFPLECNICKNRFANAITLRQHRNIHTERYKCDICGLSNKNSDGLKRHKRTHTGEKPFGCRKCEYRSTRNSDIIRHEKTCNGKKRNPPLVVIQDEHAVKDDAAGMGLEMFLLASTSSEDDTRHDGFSGDYSGEQESSEEMVLVKEESVEHLQTTSQYPCSSILSPQEMLIRIVKQEDEDAVNQFRPEKAGASERDESNEATYAVDLFEETVLKQELEEDSSIQIEELAETNEKLRQENLKLRRIFDVELDELRKENAQLKEENQRLKQGKCGSLCHYSS